MPSTVATTCQAKQSSDSFLCPHCRLDAQQDEIRSLKQSVSCLLSRVAEIETKSGLSKHNVLDGTDYGGAGHANGDARCETSHILYSSIVSGEVSPISLQTRNNASPRNDGSQPMTK